MKRVPVVMKRTKDRPPPDPNGQAVLHQVQIGEVDIGPAEEDNASREDKINEFILADTEIDGAMDVMEAILRASHQWHTFEKLAKQGAWQPGEHPMSNLASVRLCLDDALDLCEKLFKTMGEERLKTLLPSNVNRKFEDN